MKWNEFPQLVEFPEQTTEIAKNQPEYRVMSAYQFADDPHGRIVCCWELSLRDRLRVLFFGKIWQHILTFNNEVQPQLIMTDKPKMP
jgi:hypothetical protein